jgi:hypothetical protein
MVYMSSGVQSMGTMVVSRTEAVPVFIVFIR